MSHSDSFLVLYSVKDLQRIFSMSRSSVYRMVDREGFPKPVVVGPSDKRGSAARWRSDEIEAFINALPREKDLGN